MTHGAVRSIGVAGDPGGVFAALCGGYRVLAEAPATLHWTWLDTADWRLRRRGLALREERRGRDRVLVLDGPAAGETRRAQLSRVSWPAPLSALPPSPLRETLAPVVRVRALIPVAEVETRRVPMRLLDERDKTRALVSVDQQRLLTPRRASLPLHVTVSALRGYDEDTQRSIALLEAALPTDRVIASAPEAALAAAGRLPGTAVLEPVALSPGDPVTRALALALHAHAETVARTVEGVLADLDSEFLHDLRDAVYSSLALLSASGGRLPGQAPVRAATQFATLQSATAPLRAVDLALQRLDPARDLAPRTRPDLAGLEHLDPLRETLRVRRRTELRRLRRALTAERTRELREDWPGAVAAIAEEDVLGPTVAEAGPLLVARALAGLAPAELDVDAARGATRELREVVAALRPALRTPPTRVESDLAEITDVAVDVGRLQVSATTIRSCVRTGALPSDTVLDVGAWLDRAKRLEASTGARLAERLARFAAPKSHARLDALCADLGTEASHGDRDPVGAGR